MYVIYRRCDKKKLGWCLNNFCVRWRNNLSLQYFKNSLFECLKLISLSLVFSIGLSYFSDHAYLEVNYFVFSNIFFWTAQKEIFILNWQPIEAFLLVTQAPTQFLNLNRIGLFSWKVLLLTNPNSYLKIYFLIFPALAATSKQKYIKNKHSSALDASAYCTR